MYELHENEQYFFDEATLEHLTRVLGGYERVCCLCAPLLGKSLAEAGRPVTILDVDDRFADVPGFRHWDIHRPAHLADRFDLIVCDPPFFNVSLSRLFVAIRVLSHNDFTQPMLVGYLRRRANAILGTFARFGLTATGYRLGYRTVQPSERNDIELYGNVPQEVVDRLNGT